MIANGCCLAAWSRSIVVARECLRNDASEGRVVTPCNPLRLHMVHVNMCMIVYLINGGEPSDDPLVRDQDCVVKGEEATQSCLKYLSVYVHMLCIRRYVT